MSANTPLIIFALLVYYVTALSTVTIQDLPTLSVTGWTVSGTADTATLNGVSTIRVRGTGTATRTFNVAGYSSVILSASMAAQQLEAGKYCRIDYSVDGITYFTSRLVTVQQDDGNFLAQAVYTSSIANNAASLRVRFALTGGTTTDYCYYSALTILGTVSGTPASCTVDCTPSGGTGPTTRTALPYSVLWGNTVPTATVDNTAFLMPSNAAAPTNTFSGAFQLPATTGSTRVYNDTYSYTSPSLYSGFYNLLPIDSFYTFQQVGTHLIPCYTYNQRNGNRLYELLLNGGRVWNEATDNGFSRASISFALTQRNANCAWNGMMTFLFKTVGTSLNISKVYYQFTQETCIYFQLDLWGMLAPSVVHSNANACPASRISNFVNWRGSMIPRKPLQGPTGLATALNNVNYSTIPDTALDTNYISAYGVYYNGILYNEMGAARVNATTTKNGVRGSGYPFPEYLVLPSYSTSKSFVVFSLFARFAQKYPAANVWTQPISNWVTCTNYGASIQMTHQLSMVNNRYSSTTYLSDENQVINNNFFLGISAATKTSFACTQWPSKGSAPGPWVYHTTDIYLAMVALNKLLQTYESSTMDAKKFWYNEFVVPLGLSEMSYDLRQTYETWYTPQVWGAWGAFFYPDDIAKLSVLLNTNKGKLSGNQYLSATPLAQAMQNSPNNGGGYDMTSLNTDTTNNPLGLTYKYLNTLWAYNLYRDTDYTYTTCGISYTPFAKGFGGIEVAFMLNKMTYFYFGDSGQFSFGNAARALTYSNDITTGVLQSPCNYLSKKRSDDVDGHF